MKTIAVSQNGKELTRFVPGGRSTLLGRAPSCDVVMRSKIVRPVHFLIEWVGEGGFDPNKGLWTIVNLDLKSKHERDTGEGLVLSGQPVQIDQFEFKIVDDELAESQLRRGVLRRRVEVLREQDAAMASQASVAEVIYFRKDIEAVTNVCHFDHRFSTFPFFSNLPQIRFVWPRGESQGLGFLENHGEKKDFRVFNRGHEVTQNLKTQNKKVEVRSSDFITIETPEYDYFVRLVPPVKIEKTPFAWLKDATLRSILLLLLLISGLSYWMAHRPPPEKIETVEPPRTATIFMQETPPAPVEVEKVDEDVPPPAEQEAPKTVVKEAETPDQAKKPSLPVHGSKKTELAKASVKNSTTSAKKPGLNSRAPVKDVNQVGLLAKLRGGTKTGQKVSADSIVNQGVVADPVSGKTGMVVAQPPTGELGKGRGGTTEDHGGLAAASTTLKNSGSIDKKNVGALGIDGGKEKFSGGLKLGGEAGTEAGRAGLTGDGQLEVLGGLNKDAVRKALAENRRAIKTCYETSLLLKKDLEGRVTLRWKITPTGPVETVVVQSSTVNTTSLEECVMKVIRGIVFPKAPNNLPTTVIYPFVFQGKR